MTTENTVLPYSGQHSENWIAVFEAKKKEEDAAREQKKQVLKEEAHGKAQAWMDDMEQQMIEFMQPFPQEVTYRIEKNIELVKRLSAPGLGGRPEHWNATIELLVRYKDYKEVSMNIHNTDRELVALYLLGDTNTGCTGAVYNNRFNVDGGKGE
jgi:hypothetical protein